MNSLKFIHLRTHSEYSLLEGALRVKKLPSMALEADMPAVAVTDSNNLFCALEFSELAKGAGVQPIIGSQLDVNYIPTSPGAMPERPAPIVLLVQNQTGYLNLMRLLSLLWLDAGGSEPAVTLDELSAHADGLIALSGGPDGPVGRLLRNGQRSEADALVRRLKSIFGDRLYIELQRHPGSDGAPEAERLTEQGHVEIAYDLELPLVATNDVYFPDRGLYEAHDALICISEGAYVDQQGERRKLTQEHYFKSQAEMVALFADLPEAVTNTIEIAQRCAFKAEKHAPILPKFADDEVEELRRQAEEGLAARLAVIPHAADVSAYEERLQFELGIIENMGFPGYFLIVADFIKWAKEHDIPVGPGRGSGAGSLVAYALTITDLDPLRYSLLFERFLNPERVSMPDFDIDFCMDRREEVIQYVQEKYGRDKVGQIITFGAMLSKAAVRDMGRVLQLPYGQVDRLSKLIPVEGVKPVSVAQALKDEPRLREEAEAEEVVNRLLTYAQQVEGLLRNASTHAAGVVIGDRPLDRLVPLYQDPKSDMPATQFNMKWVEQAGLVKFDFLGLKTLTVIQNAIDLIRGQGRDLHISADGAEIYTPAHGAENQVNAIPLDDVKTYELYASAKTVAVFQVESSGMMDALRRMRPNCIEDIVALVALYRPGPMENIPTYCEVKNGQREIASVHPLIDHILEETQGIIVYQEQVMQIAQVMANYSLGGADLLRRAMGKKIKEAMDAERPKFEKGAAENGVDAAKASEVFDLLEKFANYGFNKSHAAAYAVVSYQTAWLKANQPVEFMAGVMNCDIHLTDKLATYVQEARKGMDIEIIPPCVNRSLASFSVCDQKIVYALGGLKGVGSDAMQLVVDARSGQPFRTLFDFARRVDLKRVGKRPLEMMARAGAFDQLDRNRRRVLESLDRLVAYSAAVHESKASQQESLFGASGDDLPEPRLAEITDWLAVERLAEEFKAIGFYLSGHPLDDYRAGLKRQNVLTHDQVTEKAKKTPLVCKVMGMVSSRQERTSAKGNRFAFVQLSDPSAAYEVTVFSEALTKYRDFLEPGARVVLLVEAQMESEQLRLRVRGVQPMDQVAGQAGGGELKVTINDPQAVDPIAKILNDAKAERPSMGRVYFSLLSPNLSGEVLIDAGGDFSLGPHIKGAVRAIDGVVSVEDL